MHHSEVLQDHVHGLRKIFFPVQDTDAFQQGTLNIKLALHSLADIFLFRNVDGEFQPGKTAIPADQLVSEQIMAVRNGIRELPSVERFAVEKLIRTKRTRRVNAIIICNRLSGQSSCSPETYCALEKDVVIMRTHSHFG